MRIFIWDVGSPQGGYAWEKQSDRKPVLEEIQPQMDRMNTDEDENHSEPDESGGVNAIGLSLHPPDLRASCSSVVRFLPCVAALRQPLQKPAFPLRHIGYPTPMVTFAEFKEQAAALTVEQRASLASFLLHSLPDPDYDVSDEEVAERFQQAKSGEVEMITFDQLKAGVMSERGR
jgi:hypothetical protein